MWWKSPYGYSKLCNVNTHTHTHTHTHTKLIHCVAIFTILYGTYYPPHGELKLICIGKFARRTWVNFIQQYGKNRQRCQQNKFYYAVWQLLLYFYREFPSKILSVWTTIFDSLCIKNFQNGGCSSHLPKVLRKIDFCGNHPTAQTNHLKHMKFLLL